MCVNQKIRSEKYKKYVYCAARKERVTFEECRECKQKEYKKVKPINPYKKNKVVHEEFSIMPKNDLYSAKRETGLVRHEVFYGTGKRELSIKYGLVIFLTPKMHNMSNKGIHFDREFDLKVKKIAQSKFEEAHTREEFISIFGKSYLDN